MAWCWLKPASVGPYIGTCQNRGDVQHGCFPLGFHVSQPKRGHPPKPSRAYSVSHAFLAILRPKGQTWPSASLRESTWRQLGAISLARLHGVRQSSRTDLVGGLVSRAAQKERLVECAGGCLAVCLVFFVYFVLCVYPRWGGAWLVCYIVCCHDVACRAVLCRCCFVMMCFCCVGLAVLSCLVLSCLVLSCLVSSRLVCLFDGFRLRVLSRDVLDGVPSKAERNATIL